MVTTHLTHTPQKRVDGREPYRDKHIVVYVLETAMNKNEHAVRLLDFVRQVFGNLEVILESNTQIFSEVTWLRSIRLSHDNNNNINLIIIIFI